MKEMLSIIVIYHGNERELLQTIDSLIQEDYKNKEIIIISTYSEEEICRKLEEKYNDISYVQYISVLENASDAILFNMGSEIATGEYLCFINAGTLCKNNRFSKQLEQIKKIEKAMWNYCIAFNRYNKDEVFPSLSWPDYKKSGQIFPDIIDKCSILLDSIVIDKELFYNMAGMDETLEIGFEKEFILRLLTWEPALFCKEVLVQARLKEVKIEEDLTAEIYYLSKFADILEQYGIKESVFVKTIELIEEYKLLHSFKQYLEILKEDSDYNIYLKQYLEKKDKKRVLKKSNSGNVMGVEKCVGCSSCYHSCPVNAIKMVTDFEGFIVPQVDEKKCIQCEKCLAVCPTQIDINSTQIPQVCYAVQAADDIRMQSSSGGMFKLLANSVLKKNGYIVGAVYDDDFCVKHIVANTEEDVYRMQTSKYTQSDITEVLPIIKEKLEKGFMVLFTGCVCQIAGLKAYLGKEFENLYTVDVVCHGVPSNDVFKQYLYDLNKLGGRIKEVNFRKKSVLGWKTGGYAKYENGKEYVAKNGDPFLMGFLQNWYLRESCYTCEFKEKKYSDITLGDFWGIQYVMPGVEDGKGTSYITINSLKGFELYRMIRSDIKRIETVKNDKAISFNPSINTVSERPKMRDVFFTQCKSKSLEKNIDHALHSQHFDIGLVLWWSGNHGNAITNYALYKLLEREYRVLAIDSGPLYPQKRFRKFAKENYICSSDYYPKGALSIIDKCCDALIVGSDQTWNVHFSKMLNCGKYYQLDFASHNTRKISYAASFGMKSAEPKGKEYKELYEKFDSISVREEFGINVCKEEYGVDAALVLDPVFLLEEQGYDELIGKANIEEKEPYICAYLLNPTVEKRMACNEIRKQMGGIKIINLTEGDAGTRDDFRHILEFENIKLNVTVEEWLYYMKNSQYVITDSFHGTCFSLIFKKNFMSFVNRQPDRFKVFEQFPDVSEHISKQYTRNFMKSCMKSLNYEQIEKVLVKEREKSKKWLENAINFSENRQ